MAEETKQGAAVNTAMDQQMELLSLSYVEKDREGKLHHPCIDITCICSLAAFCHFGRSHRRIWVKVCIGVVKYS